jgi:hypothetical protein
MAAAGGKRNPDGDRHPLKGKMPMEAISKKTAPAWQEPVRIECPAPQSPMMTALRRAVSILLDGQGPQNVESRSGQAE